MGLREKDTRKKEPTFKDLFLKAFPKANYLEIGIYDVFPWVCKNCRFADEDDLVDVQNCGEPCWNQPYFEEEGEADA